MKFINPSEISSKVMTLLDESDEFALLVSPYVKILKWHKLLKKLENLGNRNIPLVFVVREDAGNANSFDELDKLGISYEPRKNLHCKLYLNEKYGIVSSMNLLWSSEVNSLELAYQTETDQEYQELISFCKRYLEIDVNTFFQSPNQEQLGVDWRDLLYETLTASIGRPVKLNQKAEELSINTTRNNYTAFIWNSKINRLRISGILTQREFDALQYDSRLLPRIKGLELELIDGKRRHYNTIWGTLDRSLNTRTLEEADPNEVSLLSESIANFVLAIDELKMSL